MENVVQLHDDEPGSAEHRRAQLLLPWYVTERLDAEERGQVERHLASCAGCRAELAAERILKAEVVALPVGSDEGWARLRAKVAPEAQRRARPGVLATWARARANDWRAGGTWMQWGLAIQACALVLLLGWAARPTPSGADAYHALGARNAAASANIALMFSPQITERRLRETLRGVDARVVDGPTAADVYLVHVPQDGRSGALVRLKANADVTLAEPIGEEAPR